jgi:cobalt/nickel transport system permease protein
LHHVVIERWSRGRSFLHSRDPRVKLLVLLVFLVAVSTTPPGAWRAALAYSALLLAGLVLARLPLWSALARAAVVLPFSATFALVSALAGDSGRGAALLAKSYLSAVAVLLVVGTTPLPRLLRALESLSAPAVLVQVVQFVYRYLFVVSEQAQHMRLAASCRAGGGLAPLRSRFQAAAGAVAVLFGRSYGRAEGIHRAMIARGFTGHFPGSARERIGWMDLLWSAAACAAPVLVRIRVGSGF